MEEHKKYLEIVSHYESCLEKYGDTYRGMDWPNEGDAQVRYRVMLDVIREEKNCDVSLLDFGCGTGHLYEFIQRNSISQVEYIGLDISQKCVEIAKNKYINKAFYCVDILNNDSDIPVVDYVIMNGVFTEKCGLTYEEMWQYFQQLVVKVFAKANLGIAFNIMSVHVDWERKDLFHLSMDSLAAFLKDNISRHYVFRQDYGLYEYTAYVYRNPLNYKNVISKNMAVE